LQISADKIVVE